MRRCAYAAACYLLSLIGSAPAPENWRVERALDAFPRRCVVLSVPRKFLKHVLDVCWCEGDLSSRILLASQFDFGNPFSEWPTIRPASSGPVAFISGFYKSIGATRTETFERVERSKQID